MGHNVSRILELSAEYRPDKEAIVQAENEERKYTYKQANEMANKLAHSLDDYGVTEGDRVAFLTDQIAEHPIVFLGLIKKGAIPAPVHSRETSKTISEMCNSVGAKAMIFHPNFSEKASNLNSKENSVDSFIAYDFKDRCPEFAHSITDIIESGSPKNPTKIRYIKDAAFIGFSSGTTGTPKPIVRTHSQTIEATHLGFFNFNASRTDKYLKASPPSFANAINMTMTFLSAGGSVVVVDDWEPGSVPGMIETHGITMTASTPTQFRMIIENTDLSSYDLSSLNKIGYGGEVISEDLYSKLRQKLTPNIYSMYSSSEAAFISSLLASEIDNSNINTVGSPSPNVEIRVVDPSERNPEKEVSLGEIGEVFVRSPAVSERIWENTDPTERTFHSDGWWMSGDLARMDERGNIIIEGRRDNMIISGGMNIYAEKVESVIEGHSDVVECGVVGEEDEKWGEIVKAYVATSGDISPEQLEEWCKSNDELADYQRPRSYEFVDSLPHSNTGKLDREQLRSESRSR